MKVKVVRIPSRYERLHIDKRSDLDHLIAFLNNRGIESYKESDDIGDYVSISDKVIRPGNIVHVCGSTIVSIEDITSMTYTRILNKLSKIKLK